MCLIGKVCPLMCLIGKVCPLWQATVRVVLCLNHSETTHTVYAPTSDHGDEEVE